MCVPSHTIKDAKISLKQIWQTRVSLRPEKLFSFSYGKPNTHIRNCPRILHPRPCPIQKRLSSRMPYGYTTIEKPLKAEQATQWYQTRLPLPTQRSPPDRQNQQPALHLRFQLSLFIKDWDCSTMSRALAKTLNMRLDPLMKYPWRKSWVCEAWRNR
jgi:hypothetical protein